MFFKKHVSNPWFTLIKEGKKTSEGRLNKGQFSKMKKGDIVEWFNMEKEITKKVKTKIIDVITYDSFYDCIKNEKLENILPIPEITTIQEGVDNVYYKYYSQTDENLHGVLAIRIKVIN